MKILVINGANLNMLGVREKNLYGDKDYKSLIKLIKDYCKSKKVKVKCFQSNCEGEIVSAIQKAYGKYNGIVINPGAYTHTSIAILDALKSVDIPTLLLVDKNLPHCFLLHFVEHYDLKARL